MERKQKEQIIIVVTIIALVLMFIGISYAYFTSVNNVRSGSSIVAVGGKMTIDYQDGNSSLLLSTNIKPSNDILIDKTFTLTGVNTTIGEGINMPYTVSIEYQNTFQNDGGELLYFIKRTDENENISCALKGLAQLTLAQLTSEDLYGLPTTLVDYTLGYFEDWSGETYKQEIAKGEFKASSGEQVITFNLKMMFRDTGENQNYNKGATFNGKIVINDASSTEIAGQTAVDTIDRQLETQDNSLYDTKIFTDNTPDKNVRFTQNESLLNTTTVSNQNKNNYETKLLVSLANYSNNIKIFGERAKIIGIFKVKNADTGEYERLLKVQLDNYVYKQFDTNGTNNWETSSLMQELNSEDSLNIYYNYYKDYFSSSKSGNTYFDYDNDFGTVDSNTYTGVIANVEWDIGGLDSLNVSLEDAYKQERGLTPYTTNKKKWTGKIGLPSLTDYLYDKLGADCASDLSTCSTLANLAVHVTINLTLTKDNTSTSNMYLYDYRYSAPKSTSATGLVYPTFYLKKDIKFVCGDGSNNNPYRISKKECSK